MGKAGARQPPPLSVTSTSRESDLLCTSSEMRDYFRDSGYGSGGHITRECPLTMGAHSTHRHQTALTTRRAADKKGTTWEPNAKVTKCRHTTHVASFHVHIVRESGRQESGHGGRCAQRSAHINEENCKPA